MMSDFQLDGVYLTVSNWPVCTEWMSRIDEKALLEQQGQRGWHATRDNLQLRSSECEHPLGTVTMQQKPSILDITCPCTESLWGDCTGDAMFYSTERNCKRKNRFIRITCYRNRTTLIVLYVLFTEKSLLIRISCFSNSGWSVCFQMTKNKLL